MPRPRIAALALALVLGACPSAGETGGTSTSSDPGPTTTTIPTTGEALACDVPGDCPPGDPCQQLDCDDGQCVQTLRDEGDLTDDVAGDCHSLLCHKDGSSAPQVDDSDLPDDANDCTDDLCADGQPSNVARPPGSACDGSFVCHADLTCHPCPARDTCDDPSHAEPNHSQSQATTLPTVRDDADPAYLCEALGSPDDVDWFVFATIDTNLGAVAPSIAIDVADPRVCMYFQCSQGGTDVACPEATTPANAPLGQQGCCGHGSFAPAIDCHGFTEDARVWLQIHHDGDAPPACLAYQLAYAY